MEYIRGLCFTARPQFWIEQDISLSLTLPFLSPSLKLMLHPSVFVCLNITGQSWMYKMLLALWMNSVSIWRSWEITVLQRVENWIHIIVEGWSFTRVQMYVYPQNASSLVSFLIVQPLEGLWQDHDVTIPLQYTCCPSAGIDNDDDQWESDKDEMDEDMPSPRTTALVHKRPPSRQSSPLSFFL